MKNTVLLLLFLIMIVFYSNLQAEEVWKITSLDWQPYSGSNMPNQGKSLFKLKKLLASKGIQLSVEFYPWNRSKTIARTKDYVGYFPAWPEEVSQDFIASEGIDLSEISVLTYKGSKLTYKNYDDLFRHYKVGLVKTYIYPQQITEATEKYPTNIEYAPDERALMRKLSRKRTMAAITDPKVMLYLAKQEGISNIEHCRKHVIKKKLVIAFRKCQEAKKRVKLISELMQNELSETPHN